MIDSDGPADMDRLRGEYIAEGLNAEAWVTVETMAAEFERFHGRPWTEREFNAFIIVLARLCREFDRQAASYN